MVRSTLFGLAACCLAGATATAQQSVLPFPMEFSSRDASVDGVIFTPRLDQIRALENLNDVQLTGMIVPGLESEVIDLELTRIDLDRLRFGFHVDGQPRPNLAQGLNLSLWKGHVVGAPSSEVSLSFSSSGSRGWIRHEGELVHLIGRPDANGDWSNGDMLAVTELMLNTIGQSAGQYCGSDALLPGPDDYNPTPPGGQAEALGSGCGLKECTIAVETDFQLFQLFNDLGAETAYMMALLGAISDRYEGQINTILTFPYLQFYTDAGDPWNTPDVGGSTGTMLDEFLNAWQGAIPTGATLGHFISGASLGGGIAYLDVLCAPAFAFGVSANIGGDINLPIVQQSGNWDFMVIAHELGHNFAAPHTHDLGIDNCAGGDHITDGTVMSYCHLCPGGTANITTFFHPTNVANMTNAANNCLPNFAGDINGTDVNLISEVVTTPVSAQVIGTPVGNVDVLYRYSGGAYQAITMTDMGGGLYSADLPVASCGDTPEYYFTYNDAACGLINDPTGAPGTTYTAEVGTATVAVSEDFETTPGWVAVNLGATSGDWQAGVPVNDGGWDFDPSSDSDGSGSAYLTQNEVGNTDVDGGAVELTSPDLDMSGANSSLQYDYFFRNTNNAGQTDALVVEMNTNGGAGAWTEIARHDVDQGLSWTPHFISATDLANLGLTPTATTQLRFTANDGDPQSIVEAGIDALQVVSINCNGGPGDPGSPFCFGVGCPCGNDSATTGCLNSTGQGMLLSGAGSTSVAADDLVLTAVGAARNNNGLYFMGSAISAPVFVGDGVACTGGLFRYFPGTVDNDGFFVQTNPVANAFAGAITAGDTRHFQAWTRDVLCGPPPAPCNSPCGMNSNTSNGYTVTFTP